jgi:hypothetical protein
VKQGIQFKTSLTTTHEPLHAINKETNDNIEYLMYLVAANSLLDICMIIVSAVLSLDEQLSQTNASSLLKFVTIQSIVVLFSTSLSGYTLLNSS